MTESPGEKTFRILSPVQLVSILAVGALVGMIAVTIVGVLLFAAATGDWRFLHRYGPYLGV